MITKTFTIDDPKLNYSVGITQIKIDLAKLMQTYNLENEKDFLDYILNLTEEIQENYDDTFLQFFSDAFVLNLNHIYLACYYVQKAFFNHLNISNSKNIEFLLYLTGTRQIKKAIEVTGIKDSDIKSCKLDYCILTDEQNLEDINYKVVEKLFANEIKLSLNNQSESKFQKIKEFYDFSNDQIKCILNSYGFNSIDENQLSQKLENQYLVLYDLICEKMSLLSLEKCKLE